MGSEQVQEAPGTVQTRNTHAPSRTHTHPAANTRAHSWMNAPPNACCFCWCCCCSCSCLTVRAAQDEKIQRLVYERPEVTSNCEEIPEPSLEEARCWAQSFERLIKSPAGRGRFRQFLRTEFSEENLLFWLACEELKKETNRTVVEERVRQIYEDFISILSPREVSLDSRVRDVINRNMQEPSSNTFDDAQQQIYTLMQRDSYPRFMNSSAYADLIKSLEDPPSET
ncbi:regulator of G-protein signaling 20-like [Denticeps clupeoides]|uniref:regulator of G-protein signaling 20-like n=1 Tax=Denticeps clupeoides TaxID=299321 RepID=UPI0010A2B45E|nr:regulator of G-protein signaling 20-like [Denticeps clupeoides]